MVTSPTPAWSAARSGLLGDTGAVDASAQINQLLGTHPAGEIYQGNAILTPGGTGGGLTDSPLNGYDWDQPFTLSGTAIGRVTIPVFPIGAGADLIVSLHADSSGTPGTLITRTRVPATWINTQAAVTGTDVPGSPGDPILTYTGSPLATAADNTLTFANVANYTFNQPTPTGGGGTNLPATASNGNNLIILVGGSNAAGQIVGDTYTIAYGGDAVLGAPVPQSALPVGNDLYAGIAVTTDPTSGDQYVVVAGGATGTLTSVTTVATVYAASIDAATGNLGSWSAQTSLPQALQTLTSAASGNNVYTVGGVTPSNTIVDAVYYATMQNGQISAWNSGPALPVPVYNAFAAVSNGFLLVAGGYTATGLAGPTAAAWYAPINADGSLGDWQPAPPLPSVNADFASGSMTAGQYGVVLRGAVNAGLFALPMSAAGPGPAWQSYGFPGIALDALLPDGDGRWRWFEIYAGTTYASSVFTLTPYISVPLPAAGLSNGATYHVVMRSPSQDPNNYLTLAIANGAVFPGSPSALTRAKGASAWVSNGGNAVPVAVYDNSNGTATPGQANNQVVHTWEDSGARITTLVRATTPDRRMLGICEATAQPGPVLNSNPTFTAGTAPWTATNGALTQSSAQTHGSLPFSGLLAPAGGNPDAYIQSEYLACTPGPGSSYTVTAWVYSPTGWSAVFPNLNFYDASKTFISSGAASFNVPAATWTQITATYPVPDTALYLTIDVGESSTPAATNLLYVSAATVQDALGPQVSSAAQITYAGTWPGTGLYPPTGVTVLA